MAKEQEPVAWVVFADDGSESVYVASLKEQAEAAAKDYGWNIAPLYRAPTLTAAEREAIEWAINDQIAGGWEDHETVKDVLSVLRGLLETLA
jgi:hypothetical protein